ncbi:unnamed protein product, partial [Closterium sp. Naga37s-1]
MPSQACVVPSPILPHFLPPFTHHYPSSPTITSNPSRPNLLDVLRERGLADAVTNVASHRCHHPSSPIVTHTYPPPPLPPSRPNLLDVLRERGLADAVTSEAFREAAEHPLKIYVGFDPTAESLHLGNLLGIIFLAWAQRCDYTAVALLGVGMATAQ